MKKFLIIISTVIMIVILVLCFVSQRSDIYKKHQKYRQTFGIIQYETLNHLSSKTEKNKIEPMFEQVKSAISYAGYKNDCKIDKTLFELCRFKDDYNYNKNVSNVDLITYKELGNTGYLWIEYTRELFDSKNDVIGDEYDVLCLIKVKKDNTNLIIDDVIIEP